MSERSYIASFSYQDRLISVHREAADWAVSVSLGLASLLCVAFIVGFLIRKL